MCYSGTCPREDAQGNCTDPQHRCPAEREAFGYEIHYRAATEGSVPFEIHKKTFDEALEVAKRVLNKEVGPLSPEEWEPLREWFVKYEDEPDMCQVDCVQIIKVEGW